jgi:hypothetical protein
LLLHPSAYVSIRRMLGSLTRSALLALLAALLPDLFACGRMLGSLNRSGSSKASSKARSKASSKAAACSAAKLAVKLVAKLVITPDSLISKQ